MALLRNVFRRLRFWKRTSAEPVVSSEHDFTRTLKRYEYFVYKIQHILLWENPLETILTFVVIYLLFWLLAASEWRFYGILFTVLLISTLYELWTKEIWPEIRAREPPLIQQNMDDISKDDPNYASLIRLSRVLETTQKCAQDYYYWLKNMREKKPGMFCFMMTSVFFVLSFVGRIVPGLVLIYVVIMFGFLAPGLWVHVLSEDCKKLVLTKWNMIQYSICHPSDDLPSEEDYLPDATNEELAILSQFVEAENMNEDVNSRGSSATQLSAASLSLMPSHDDTSIDSLATYSDLDINVENSPKTIQDIEDFTDESSGNEGIDIDFQTGHFNGDESSSEEEKVFTSDLKFSETDSAGNVLSSSSSSTTVLTAVPSVTSVQSVDYDDKRSRDNLSGFIASNLIGLSALGHSYLVNVINRNTSASNASRKKSDAIVKNDSSDSLASDEDFEMISHDDVS
ncbi:uncharacterized protein LOC142333550 [Lycorma delicatula]|uniref:uncharacterized protein LOC142333550 n=1 Tax=Lycorma delicatula TaxID=130591 RepID=UPI003F51760E